MNRTQIFKGEFVRLDFCSRFSLLERKDYGNLIVQVILKSYVDNDYAFWFADQELCLVYRLKKESKVVFFYWHKSCDFRGIIK